jgi:thiamine kinase-like enzyme
MGNKPDKILTGGNMNLPILRGNMVYKKATIAGDTIHELLQHVRAKGIDWVPESLGIDSKGKQVMTYIEGDVPHNMPDWIYEEGVLKEIARRLRQWHDATEDFRFHKAKWLMENDEVQEVICHNDFAPYNCVFNNKKFVGLIDFDVCSPGSRLWDIVYTAYRFIPLLPVNEIEHYCEVSPFSKEEMLRRLQIFLEEYSCGEKDFFYSKNVVIEKVSKRLKTLASWSEAYGQKTKNKETLEHAKMYSLHAQWIITNM